MTAYTFNQLIDFTRTSAATFVGSNGLTQLTPQSRNLLTFTQEFDNAAWTKTAATVTANTTAAPDGTSTADKLEELATTSRHFIRQSAGAVGSLDTFSVYAKKAERIWVRLDIGASGASAFFNLDDGTSNSPTGSTISMTLVGNGWYRCSITAAHAIAGSAAIFLSLDGTVAGSTYAGTAGSGVFIWGAQLEQAATATDYTRNVGGLFPPRFDYDPVTLAPRGILIEEQRVNLATWSEDFSNAIWTSTAAGLTVATNAAVAPDGTTTADKLAETATNDTHRRGFAISGLARVQYVFSVYAKAAERTILRGWSFSGGDTTEQTFDLANGTSTGSLNPTITPVGNGWYRCSFTVPSANAASVVFGPSDGTGSTTAYPGVAGFGIFVWGAQVEAGAFATSYIPTVASQVTRTADQASIVAPMFAPWFNLAEGTFLAEYDVASYSNLPSALGVNSASSPGFNSGGGLARWWNGSSNIATANSNTTTAVRKEVFAYTAATRAIALNGGTVATDANVPWSTAPTATSLGSVTAAGAQSINGHIRNIRFYPVRLSDLQLQALTS